METMQWKAIPQHGFEFNIDAIMCISKPLNKVIIMGGLSREDFSHADDVYCWDLINDRVTRRNSMPHQIKKKIKVVASSDKIYGVSLSN